MVNLSDFEGHLDGIVLGAAVVGSQMWGMARPDSDKDYYVLYLGKSSSILTGDDHPYHGGIHSTEEGAPEQFAGYELGHSIHQLRAGNVNHLWGLLSPIVVKISPLYDELRGIVMQNLAKNCYPSIHGLAKHNLQLWFYREKDREYPLNRKKLNIIARTLQFGIAILQGLGAQYKATNYETVQDVEALVGTLDTAYKESKLPEKPNPAPFKEYLLRCRVTALRAELKYQRI